MQTRRQILSLVAGTTALSLIPNFTWAQSYPTRPLRILVGFAAGGNFDTVARLLGQCLSEQFNQPVKAFLKEKQIQIPDETLGLRLEYLRRMGCIVGSETHYCIEPTIRRLWI